MSKCARNKKCFVNGCFNSSKKQLQLQFFCVPRNMEKRKAWFKIANADFSCHQTYCCAEHFLPDDFGKSVLENGKRVLCRDALPNKNLNILPDMFLSNNDDIIIEEVIENSEVFIFYLSDMFSIRNLTFFLYTAKKDKNISC
jgi:hypothetical protein